MAFAGIRVWLLTQMPISGNLSTIPMKPESKSHFAVTLFVLAGTALSHAAGTGPAIAGEIPYPQALEAAAVVQPAIDDVDRKALVIGNGDLNALVFSRNHELVLHVAKNDVWDARLETAKDAPLLKVDVRHHTWTGGEHPPSWNLPYPTQTPACTIHIPFTGEMVSARLDVRHAVATITTTGGTITIRALAQGNVFYVESAGAASLQGFAQPFLPAAETHTGGAVDTVTQNLPGDIDYKGMSVAAVRESKGQRQAIAVVTSRTAADPASDARRLAESTLAAEAADVIRTHEETWQKFWSASGVLLGDADMQNWWYRQLYYFRCLSRPGAYAIALQGGYNSKANWHGTWTANYNCQQTFWAAFNSNHPELAEPFIDLVNEIHPRSRWYAQTVFGCDGAATPHNLWPFQPDPATCQSVNHRQFAFMPWSYGIGLAGHVGSILALHYAYTGDKAYLKTKIYPVLKDYADFYASFVDQCQVTNGKVAFGPSVDPEHTAFGIDNSPYDLAWAKCTLRSAMRAATDLAVDGGPVVRWQHTLDKLPAYPSTGAPGQEIIEVPGVQNYNIVTPVVPLFPADQASWFSPQAEKDMFKRTIEWIQSRYNHNNSVVMLNVARARLSLTDEAYADTKSWFKDKEQPNGLFFWQAHGYYISEQTAVAGLINEFLLQSVDDIIRVFPAWPQNLDARFTQLRARGGFLVTAEQKAGKIVKLEITSTIGGPLRWLNPWTREIVTQATRPGQTLELKPAAE